MQRVYGVIDDEVFHQMGEAVDESKSSRAQWIGEAIIEKLRRRESGDDIEAMKLRDEISKLRDENKHLNDEIVHHKQLLTSLRDERNDEAMKLRDELAMKIDEQNSLSDEQSRKIANLNDELVMKNDELDKLKQQIKQTSLENTERWQETKSLRADIVKLKKDLEDTQSENQHLKDELLKRQSETEPLAKLREELAAASANRDRLQDALKIRDDDIAYFKSHVAQLTQTIGQLSLPPSQEEAKAKHWWRFWK
jgi:chromosome segregation ATPase